MSTYISISNHSLHLHTPNLTPCRSSQALGKNRPYRQFILTPLPHEGDAACRPTARLAQCESSMLGGRKTAVQFRNGFLKMETAAQTLSVRMTAPIFGTVFLLTYTDIEDTGLSL